VEPDSTVFLNTAPLRSAFPKLTRSKTAFEKSTPANNWNHCYPMSSLTATLSHFQIKQEEPLQECTERTIVTLQILRRIAAF
jgi:hypothetical protein